MSWTEASSASSASAPPACAPPLPDPRLAAWLEAIVERDERALGALYDATVTRVYGFVRRIVRSEALAQEVVEDTYFQVWRQAPRYDGARGGAMSWLLAMARSRAIDALRREARFEHEELADDDGAPGADGGPQMLPADELLALARHHAALHLALQQLGAQPRQLVSLAFFRGLSHEEIAEQMRLPLGTVKSQIRRALLTLRQSLGDGAPLASAS
jgi:RNA polymerase sigma-70 factor (ECF subfamily)